MKMKLMIAGVVVVVLATTGCFFSTPTRSKALSEKKPVKLLVEQNVQLTRIADALETLTQ